MRNTLAIKAPFTILPVVLLSVFFNSCTKQEDLPDYYVNTPIAGFSWTGNEGPAPVTVQFINTSENSDQFEWTFGDGQTSTQRDPVHTFNNSSSEPKNFNVVLKATDTYSGLYQRRSQVIVIQPQS
jgi:PKD repeat protein